MTIDNIFRGQSDHIVTGIHSKQLPDMFDNHSLGLELPRVLQIPNQPSKSNTPYSVLITSSQINSSKFGIWYREGPQKLKKQSTGNSVNL